MACLPNKIKSIVNRGPECEYKIENVRKYWKKVVNSIKHDLCARIAKPIGDSISQYLDENVTPDNTIRNDDLIDQISFFNKLREQKKVGESEVNFILGTIIPLVPNNNYLVDVLMDDSSDDDDDDDDDVDDDQDWGDYDNDSTNVSGSI
eukprot:320184_1